MPRRVREVIGQLRRARSRLRVSYEPDPNGRPNPGEVVWMWVPFEDDPSQGKDRPVLIIGRVHGHLAGLMLSSQDHDGDPDEEGAGRMWLDIGSGPWDRRRRPSEVRLDRLITVSPDEMRREGAVLDRERFDQVAAALHELGDLR